MCRAFSDSDGSGVLFLGSLRVSIRSCFACLSGLARKVGVVI